MILGTAGHIDHGKTTLIRALTGVDADRLPEEKRRGITIELGFAPLEIEGVGTIGVVDVPGHEAFVRTMLAGATGIDLALVVVAGDEGIMPQTREHLAILDLLGVSRGVVAITKSDLAEPEWLQLVAEDVRGALAEGPLRDAPIVPCSASSGAGLPELRAAIRDVAATVPSREADGVFRMPIDRAFSVRGTGTVVTGTVWAGSLGVDEGVLLLPGGRSARVRGIESHGVAAPRAVSGARTAIALAGVDRADIEPRGTVLVKAGDPWVASTILRADVTLLGDAPTLGPRTRVRFHLGTAETGARLIAVGGAVKPGARVPVRISLDAPVVARAGDRFVIRAPSPAATIGGGVITDSDPPRRRARPWPSADASAADRLGWIVAEAAGRGVALSGLDLRVGVTAEELALLVGGTSPNAPCRIAARAFSQEAVASVKAACLSAIGEAHKTHPLDPGVSVQSLRSGLAASPDLVDHALGLLVDSGDITVSDGTAARAGWVPGGSTANAAKIRAVLDALVEAGTQPPAIDELAARFGAETLAILKILARQGDVVAVATDRYFAAGAIAELTGIVRASLSDGRELTASELREATGLTRKYMIPFLEYCDRAGITVRLGDVRRLA